MDTKVINSGDQNRYSSLLCEAATALRDGAIVVFPTETVYGVAANAFDPTAMDRLREVKGRAGDQAFTVHLATPADASRYVSAPSPLARRLARKIWPGPLTLVCQVSDPAGEPVAGECKPEQLAEIYHESRVGLRCPAHMAATELLRESGVPVVASSANRTGNPPPADLHDALRDLGGVVEYAIDGGPARLSAASTIVEVDQENWTVRRQGAIDERTIKRLATSTVLMVCTGNSCRSPLAEYLFREKLAARLGVSVAQLAKLGYAVESAGTIGFRDAPISAGSLEELRRRGIDASGHRSQPLTIELLQRCERIFTMSPEHRAAVIEMVPGAVDRVLPLDENGPVGDPIGGGPDEYRSCAEHIERVLDARLEEFLNEDRDW